MHPDHPYVYRRQNRYQRKLADGYGKDVLHEEMCYSLLFFIKTLEGRKPREAAAVLFGLKFADNIHYKLKSSQASKAWLQSSKHTGAK